MPTIRRIGLALVVLGLILPPYVAPVAAHVGAGWALEWGVRRTTTGWLPMASPAGALRRRSARTPTSREQMAKFIVEAEN